jgi:hypothetical protein
MGKGIKGTLRPNYSTNSGIFEKRGDPWVTTREGVKDFGRNIETEDAERDFAYRHFDTAFGPKPAKPHVEAKEQRPTKSDDDPERRKASIARRMQMAMNRRSAGTIKVDAPTRTFNPCPGCKAAQCIAQSRCFGALR